MSEKYLSISEAAKRLGVHTGTLRRWANEGKINYARTPGGRRRFSEDEILRLLGKPSLAEVGKKVRAVIYARVSTLKQADEGESCEGLRGTKQSNHTTAFSGNLERQLSRLASYCLEKGYAIVDSCNDIASGLNPNRRGLNKLFSLVSEKKVDCIIVEYQDRLARFGYEYIQRYCLESGVAIEIINQQEDKDLNQELVDDLISIVSSFSARIYGRRGGRVAKKVATLLMEGVSQASHAEKEKCIE